MNAPDMPNVAAATTAMIRPVLERFTTAPMG